MKYRNSSNRGYEGCPTTVENVEYLATRHDGCQGCAFKHTKDCMHAKCTTDSIGKSGFIYVTKLEYITRRLTK